MPNSPNSQLQPNSPIDRLHDWGPSERVERAKLTALARAVSRTNVGVPPSAQLDPSLQPGWQGNRRNPIVMHQVHEYGDVLLCRQTGSQTTATIGPGTIVVAKPPIFRVSWWNDGNVHQGVIYQYPLFLIVVASNSRSASWAYDMDGTTLLASPQPFAIQRYDPGYSALDIVCALPINGDDYVANNPWSGSVFAWPAGVDISDLNSSHNTHYLSRNVRYLDVNMLGRRWAVQSPTTMLVVAVHDNWLSCSVPFGFVSVNLNVALPWLSQRASRENTTGRDGYTIGSYGPQSRVVSQAGQPWSPENQVIGPTTYQAGDIVTAAYIDPPNISYGWSIAKDTTTTSPHGGVLVPDDSGGTGHPRDASGNVLCNWQVVDARAWGRS
jgi:hypothetical protein